MEVRTAYCATHDRPVRIMVKPGAGPDAGLDDMVCVEHGATCTGAMCPIFDVPTQEMREKLEAYHREVTGGEEL